MGNDKLEMTWTLNKDVPHPAHNEKPHRLIESVYELNQAYKDIKCDQILLLDSFIVNRFEKYIYTKSNVVVPDSSPLLYGS